MKMKREQGKKKGGIEKNIIFVVGKKGEIDRLLNSS